MFVKGLDVSLTVVMSLVIGVMILVIVGLMLSGNIAGLEEFASENLAIGLGGTNE